jgi:hypothetical protein
VQLQQVFFVFYGKYKHVKYRSKNKLLLRNAAMDTTKAKTNSVYDLIATLRTLRFPECARAALEQLASIHQRGGFSSLPGVGAEADEIESQIIKEFVLFQSSKRVILKCNFFIQMGHFSKFLTTFIKYCVFSLCQMYFHLFKICSSYHNLFL